MVTGGQVFPDNWQDVSHSWTTPLMGPLSDTNGPDSWCYLGVALDGFVTTNFCDIVIGSLELGGMLRSASTFSSSFRISPSQPFFLPPSLPPSLSFSTSLDSFLSLTLFLPQFFSPSTPSSILPSLPPSILPSLNPFLYFLLPFLFPSLSLSLSHRRAVTVI